MKEKKNLALTDNFAAGRFISHGWNTEWAGRGIRSDDFSPAHGNQRKHAAQSRAVKAIDE